MRPLARSRRALASVTSLAHQAQTSVARMPVPPGKVCGPRSPAFDTVSLFTTEWVLSADYRVGMRTKDEKAVKSE